MARTPKAAADAAVKTKSLTASGFKKVLADAERARENAAEYGSMHGATVKNLIEQHSLEKTAFGFARRVARSETIKAQAIAGATIRYLHLAGIFDQVDAFSDLTTSLRAIVDELEARKETVPVRSAVLDDLTDARPTVN